jgi:hypothetical protein
MAAGKYKIVVEQGATFHMDFTIYVDDTTVWNLTGYSARMQVRASVESVDVILSATNSNYITLGGTAGTVDLDLPASVTEDLPAGRFVYDFELVSAGGEVWRVLEGSFVVDPEVTR